jgi:dsDNA-specific endonuclease/ATPase MutS2
VNLQLNYFRNYLDLAIKDHIKNIVFIHGVGNGTLKGEIRKTLDEMYPKLSYSDASMAKYGVGATEIEIPHNYNR